MLVLIGVAPAGFVVNMNASGYEITRTRDAVNNVETYIACALAGLGLIQVPAYDVQDHLRSGELVELLQPWPAPTMPVNLVYPHRRHLSRRVQAFATWLADVLAPHLR